MDRIIIKNSLRTPDGTELISQERWDYVTYKDKNGKTYMVDGGCDYLRRSNNGDEVDTSVYIDDKFELVRETLTWGTYGKNGDEQFKRVKLKDMSVEHINAIIETQKQITQVYKDLLKTELYYRKSLNKN